MPDKLSIIKNGTKLYPWTGTLISSCFHVSRRVHSELREKYGITDGLNDGVGIEIGEDISPIGTH